MLKNTIFLLGLLVYSSAYAQKPSIHLTLSGGLGEEIQYADKNLYESTNISYEVGINSLYDMPDIDNDCLKGDMKYGTQFNTGSKVEFLRYEEPDNDFGAFVAPIVKSAGYTEALGIAQYTLDAKTYRAGVGVTLDRDVLRPIASFTVLKDLKNGKMGFVKTKLDGLSMKKGDASAGFFETSVMFGVEAPVSSLSQ